MSHFRSDDFVYYALKAKPINKKPKKPKAPSMIAMTSASACDMFHHPPKIITNCLNQVDVINKPSPVPKQPSKSKIINRNYQTSLLEMQKAVRDQETMYRRYCHHE